MSVTGFFSGGIERTAPVLLSSTSSVQVYAATDRNVTIGAVAFANDDASAIVVQLYYNNGSSDFLIWKKSIPANDSASFDYPIRLYSGDKIKATAATANKITATPVVVRSHPNAPVG